MTAHELAKRLLEGPDVEVMYYVLYQGEEPIKIFFDKSTAEDVGSEYRNAYLDLFDSKGNKVASLKLVVLKDDDEDFKYEWTNNF